ncbi:DUF6538 domain-containing protein [Paenochrobactrum glaciei]|uniref:Integrase n=1 Tax=Paenochrobactrum glaciei TaxID=486407 RepID=A0ABP3QWE8_9HYPH
MKQVIKKSKGLYTRGNTYYVRKTIPAHLRKIAGQREFIVSLKTQQYEIAIQRYAETIKSIDHTMQNLINGSYTKDDANFEHYQKIAASKGRHLECISQIIHDPHRIASIANKFKEFESNEQLSKHVVQSYVKFKDTRKKISQLVDIYLEANKLKLAAYNTREHDRKINPFKNASKQLSTFLKKDKFVNDITKQDARSFYNELKDRIFNKKITANTANKYLTHLRVLVDTYNNEQSRDHGNPFLDLRFTDEKTQQSPLTIDFIKARWIGNPVFDKLSRELKHLVLAMIDTGCGFKELCGIDPLKDIHLDAPIPYISIRPNQHRMLKNKSRKRDIPLVNFALEAFKQFPNGFTHYNTDNGPTNASAAVNKFLKKNNLFENAEQSANSIRHCFKDRLRHHYIPAEIQDELMGHTTKGMGSHYGNGHTLEQKYNALQQITEDFK